MESGIYCEALCCIDKAEAELKKSGRDDNHYTKKKYVKAAGGIAYAGILQATKQSLALNGFAVSDDEREITLALSKLNQKLLNPFNHFYSYLYCGVHLHGNANVTMLGEVMKEAREFIGLLKPAE